MIDYATIAAKVLAKACIFDHRLDPAPQTITAWAEAFADSRRVWTDEALKAVTNHYSQPNPFPIFPGDVIAYCREQPIWSSPEHAADTLGRLCRDHPHSPAIEEYTGERPPEDDPAAWWEANRDRLIMATMTRKQRTLELGR